MSTIPSYAHPYAKVDVDLGDRAYPIHIGPGLLADAANHLGALVSGRHVVIIADKAVATDHLPMLKETLNPVVSRLDDLTIAGGEGSKSLACFGQVMEDILALGIDRKVMLIALGGGGIGD